MIKRGVAICHYNRLDTLDVIVQAVTETAPEGTRIVLCDDGSYFKQDNYITDYIHTDNGDLVIVAGSNQGVAANKNRALFALQDCDYICILEDDLKPVEKGWFETYEQAAILSGIHHFCRVQNKFADSLAPQFDSFMAQNGLTPTYGPSPRGDLTFLTNLVVRNVGAFNPKFRGAGYAHGEWSRRCDRAGMINHPNKWMDIKEASDKFIQIGDTEGGRWNDDEKLIRRQLQRNKGVLKELDRTPYIHHELVLE